MVTRDNARFSCLAAALFVAAVGCSAADEPNTSGASALVVDRTQPLLADEGVYRVASPRAPDWMLRLVRTGSAIEGHAVRYVSVRESSNATLGNVTGTIDANGTVTLSIEPPEPWSPMGATPPATFRGVSTNAGLEGTLEFQGATEVVTLGAIARGATDETGAPLAATLRLVPAASCPVDVTAVEFFALENDVLERRLNALLARAAKDAARHCEPAVDSVSGGARVTLLRPNLVSVANVYTLVQLDETVSAARPERHTYDLAKGDELALFGDVLAVGSEAGLLAALDSSIDQIRPDVISDEDRAALKTYVRAALADGRLAARWGLTEDSLAFDVAPDFVHPRISGIRVRYDDLVGVRSESGRAVSAWRNQ